jgi:hypothetical protein
MAKEDPPILKMAVANGALLEVPLFEKHHRGTNWMAVIDIDGTAPGGFSRRWVDRGKGECFYLIDQVTLFDPIEFGADYSTFNGRRYRKRWYGVVIAKTENYLLVEECAKGTVAVLLSKAKRTDPIALADAIDHERDVILRRAEELRGASEQLRSGEIKPEDVLVTDPSPEGTGDPSPPAEPQTEGSCSPVIGGTRGR